MRINRKNPIKKFIMKERENLLQKRNKRYRNYEELLRSYSELENTLKMVIENFKIIDPENNLKKYKRSL